MSVCEIGDIDPEVVAICDAMNALPGIRTHGSCCGHAEREFMIWFEADSVNDIAQLSFAIDGCHSGVYGWRIVIQTDCAASWTWRLESTSKGDLAYAESREQARSIVQHVEELSR